MEQYDDVLHTTMNQSTALRGVAERIRKDGRKVYDARIGYASGKNKHIGTFWTAEAAALAWDSEARLKRGNEALTNFPEEYAATRGSPWALKVPANKAEAVHMLELGWNQQAAVPGGDGGTGSVAGESERWPDRESAHPIEHKSRSGRQRANHMSMPTTLKEVAVANLGNMVGNKVPRKVRTRDGKRKFDKAIAAELGTSLLNGNGIGRICNGNGELVNRKQGRISGVLKVACPLGQEGHNKKIKGWRDGGKRFCGKRLGVGTLERDGRRVRKKGAHRQKRSEKKYKGITKRFTAKGETVWHVQIVHQGKCLHLGTVRDPLEGAVIWDAKARELRGDDTETNFPLGFLPLPAVTSTEQKIATSVLDPPAAAPRAGSESGGVLVENSKDSNVDNLHIPKAHNGWPVGLVRAAESEGGSQYWENGGHACNHQIEDEDEEVTGGGQVVGRALASLKQSATAMVVAKRCTGGAAVNGMGKQKGDKMEGNVQKLTRDVHASYTREILCFEDAIMLKEHDDEKKSSQKKPKLGACDTSVKQEGGGEGRYFADGIEMKQRRWDGKVLNGVGVKAGKEGVREWGVDGDADDKWELGEELEWEEQQILDSVGQVASRLGEEGDEGFHVKMTKHVGVFEKHLDQATQVFEVWVGLGALKKRCLGTYETQANALTVFELEQRRIIKQIIASKCTHGGSFRDGQGKSKRFKLLSSLS